MPHELIKLPYPTDALEPHIDRQTVELHHGKHHAAYVANLNKALEGQSAWRELGLEELLSRVRELPDSIRQAVINHGGGVLNHNVYWQILGPDAGGEPKGALAEAIRSAFGGFQALQQKLTAAALGRFGSGWAWLIRTKEGRLEVTSTANQDSPVSDGHQPLLAIDVWEHAYYLKYQNRRADHVAALWNVVNWDEVGRRFQA
jgi:Fe-Mn family superoxide dismutase